VRPTKLDLRKQSLSLIYTAANLYSLDDARSPMLDQGLMHRSAWKGYSANFAQTEFREVRVSEWCAPWEGVRPRRLAAPVSFEAPKGI
jgi:hypothetical protein